jgi:hypothetical protein
MRDIELKSFIEKQQQQIDLLTALPPEQIGRSAP